MQSFFSVSDFLTWGMDYYAVLIYPFTRNKLRQDCYKSYQNLGRLQWSVSQGFFGIWVRWFRKIMELDTYITHQYTSIYEKTASIKWNLVFRDFQSIFQCALSLLLFYSADHEWIYRDPSGGVSLFDANNSSIRQIISNHTFVSWREIPRRFCSYLSSYTTLLLKRMISY